MGRRVLSDDLDEMIAEREARAPGYADRVEEALVRRRIAKALAARREAMPLSQTEVAALMKTSQSVVSKLESGADVQLSTLLRYCAVVGVRRVAVAGPMRPPRG